MPLRKSRRCTNNENSIRCNTKTCHLREEHGHGTHKKYTFKVAVDANKTEIKQAIEEIFDVEVKKVNVINMDGKLKRLGRTQGRRSAYKKAIVTLSPDSKEIEFFQSL